MENKILQYGLVTGSINILLLLGLYIGGPELMTGYLAAGAGLVIGMGTAVYFGLRARADNGGYFTFGQAFKAIFSIGFIGLLIQLIFTYLLYNVIDPDLAERVMEATLANAESMYRKMGMGEEQIAKSLEIVSGQDPSMSPLKLLIALLSSSAVGAIGAAIIAAIIKRANPNDDF